MIIIKIKMLLAKNLFVNVLLHTLTNRFLINNILNRFFTPQKPPLLIINLVI